MDPLLLQYIGMVVLITVTPGPDMALLTHSVLTYGRKSAFLNIAGMMSAVCIHISLTVVGALSLFHRYPWARPVLQAVGAGYLLWLGSTGLYHLWRTRRILATPVDIPVAEVVSSRQPQALFHLRRGFLSTLLNAKLLFFYLTILPSFLGKTLHPTQRALVLALIQMIAGLVWLPVYVTLLHGLRAYLLQPRVRRWLEAITSCVLLGLGANLLWESAHDLVQGLYGS